MSFLLGAYQSDRPIRLKDKNFERVFAKCRYSKATVKQKNFIVSALLRPHAPIDWLIRCISVVLPCIFLATVILQPWVEAKWMFLDPLTAAQLSGDCCHSHYGFVSTAGVILWAATAAIAFFATALMLLTGHNKQSWFFAFSAGMLTAWFALDDAYLLHETVMPAFGIPQNSVLAAYVLAALLYFTFNLLEILKSDFWLFALATGGLALSMTVDTVFQSLDPKFVLLEDSAKFFGIFCWASYHITTLLRLVIAAENQSAEKAIQ